MYEEPITQGDLLRERLRRKMKEDFPTFFKAARPKKDYEFGRHTKAILKRLDKVTKDLEKGKSTYLCICVPPRHGKSDIASRRWPVWHLGRNPEHEIILAAYNDGLATDLSYDARTCFREWAPYVFDVALDRDRQGINRWRLHGHQGVLFAVGIGGTITGRGAHILAIDDYMKNREEAESEVMREKVWDSFATDLWTRRAPEHAVVITANRWHEDDLVGRIKRRNDPNSKDYDPEFPKFEILSFPAETAPGKWLFSRRFSKKWYSTLKAVLGSHGWSALGLQNPVPRTGNMFRTNMVKVLSPDEFDQMTHNVTFYRGWDLASTKKERAKNDPDFSAGTKAGFRQGSIFIADCIAGQWTGDARNEIIKTAAQADGSKVRVIIETIGGYKDAFIEVQGKLRGLASVTNFIPVNDKVARATFLESYFELGNVYLRDGPWVTAWVNEFTAFPSVKHDDRVDSLVTALHDVVIKPFARLHK